MSELDAGPSQSVVGPTSVAPPALERVTTRFYAVEDRIGISGELSQGQIMLWLTQRMLRRLLPVLVDWLATYDPMEDLVLPSSDLYVDLLQGFAQQVARKQLEQMPPVPPVSGCVTTPEHLVSSVQVERSAQCVRMVFSSEQAPVAQMVLVPQSLRQWLNILFDAWQHAAWPAELWPAWMRGGGAFAVNTPSIQIH